MKRKKPYLLAGLVLLLSLLCTACGNTEEAISPQDDPNEGLGGGVSEDMDERLESGTWHSEEMPTAEELAAAEERLTQSGGVDLIITHQPSDRMRIFLGGDRTEISPLGAFLDRVEQEMQFGSWYFGRLHKDKKIPPRQQAVFREVVPAEQR